MQKVHLIIFLFNRYPAKSHHLAATRATTVPVAIFSPGWTMTSVTVPFCGDLAAADSPVSVEMRTSSAPSETSVPGDTTQVTANFVHFEQLRTTVLDQAGRRVTV